MSLAGYFDHTLLRPDLTLTDVHNLCREAKQYGFHAVCIPPYFVAEAVQELKDSGVQVVSVAGFPMGYTPTAAKVEEIKKIISDGADELDVVLNIAALKSGHLNAVRNDIDSMTMATHLKGKKIKVILEAGLLHPKELEEACRICSDFEVDFVKTSTSMHNGATPQMVEQLVRLVGPSIKVKASGGIRTAEEAQRLLDAGAARLGSSASVRIMQEQGLVSD
jgi:deoxyribose-phosphate aldolase